MRLEILVQFLVVAYFFFIWIIWSGTSVVCFEVGQRFLAVAIDDELPVGGSVAFKGVVAVVALRMNILLVEVIFSVARSFWHIVTGVHTMSSGLASARDTRPVVTVLYVCGKYLPETFLILGNTHYS